MHGIRLIVPAALALLAAPVWADGGGESYTIIIRIAQNLQAIVTNHIAEIAVLCLVIVGAMWLLSFGNEDGIKRANASLRSIVIGLVLIVFAAPLVAALLDLMGSVGGLDLSDMKRALNTPPAVEQMNDADPGAESGEPEQ